MAHAQVIRAALMRRKAVETETGLPRSSLFSLIAKNEFPAPVRLSARAVAWRSGDVAAWIESRISTKTAA